MPLGLGTPEILLILVVLVLLFGAKRLPDTARSLGKSMRIFKAETKAMKDEDEIASQPAQSQAQAPAQPPAPPRSIEASAIQPEARPVSEPDRTER